MKRLTLAFTIALLAVLPASAQSTFQAKAPINVTSTIAANNTTAIKITGNSAAVYQVDGYANGTTIAYVKLYNGAATCGSGTPRARYMIPYGTDSSGNPSGGGYVTPNINGDAYPNGVWMCITGGIADNDTTAPAAATFIANVHWKN